RRAWAGGFWSGWCWFREGWGGVAMRGFGRGEWGYRLLGAVGLAALAVMVVGCHKKANVAYQPPPPPAVSASNGPGSSGEVARRAPSGTDTVPSAPQPPVNG